MQKKYIYLIVAFTCLIVFTTCHKYSEGGWSNVAVKHLFGQNQKRSIKNWKLNTFEVNGIDSTEYTNLYKTNVEFRIGTFKDEYYTAIGNSLYEYGLSFSSNKHKYMKFKQSALVGALLVNQHFTRGFYRNVFNPPCVSNEYFQWEVIRLTKNELIIIANDGGNSYKIILSH